MNWFRVSVATACFALMGFMAPSALLAQSEAEFTVGPNLVHNGDFSENGGSLDGWTYNQASDNFYWESVPLANNVYSASNGCLGTACITPAGPEQDYLYQSICTLPFLRYKLRFTYDAGAGGVNELKVLFGKEVVKDIVNAPQGPQTYTVIVCAHDFNTVLNFLGRQDAAFSFLTDVSLKLEL